ncbi:hypothetical protein [Almyronema epifaneia]|uniref:Uncharacterized protein n=1 Tax=Almyronema epifaneia S1 TaxID=2991925 RepID=A0ABW6IC25_9CYAN
MLDPLSMPNSAEVRPAAKAFELQQWAIEFRQEVAYREDLEAYCQWYDQTAAENQQTLAAMQREIDFFGCFWRRRSQS